MGYPMTWRRLMMRNQLSGGYSHSETPNPGPAPLPLIAGDSRRLETDTLDERHLAAYARLTGCKPERIALLFRAFFGLPEPGCSRCDAQWRCSDHVLDYRAPSPTEGEGD